MSEPDDQDVAKVANEILRYLTAHEHAADTLEGVTQWWVARQRFEESRRTVRRALERLCQEGVIKARPLAGGDLLYSLNKGRGNAVSADDAVKE